MKNLIGISGKMGSGKDTVGSMLQYLTRRDLMPNFKSYEDFIANPHSEVYDTYKIKKFADKLKDMVCILLGCTREQLEDREFKEKELGEEWFAYKVYKYHCKEYKIFNSKEEAEAFATQFYGSDGIDGRIVAVKRTPRLILQLLGTNCGRDIIHPNIWINALFADYKSPCHVAGTQKPCSCMGQMCGEPINWIITDVRFPDEVKAIEDRGGIVIRVNRKITSEEWQKLYPKVIVLDPDGWNRDERYQYEWFEERITLEEYKIRVMRSTCKFKVDFQDYFEEHPSETALDNHDFNYVIENNGSIEELVETVKKLL